LFEEIDAEASEVSVGFSSRRLPVLAASTTNRWTIGQEVSNI
jgi:hypothetical protein